MRKIILFTTFLAALTLMTSAQDARFSQPWTAPLMLNPALSGDFDGYLRIGGLTSWQREDNKKVAHQYAYLDNRLNRKGGDSSNAYWGFGLTYYRYGDDPFNFYKSRTPIIGTFTAVTISYNFNLDTKGQHSMGVGLQVANASGKADESRREPGYYEKEITGGGFNWQSLQDYPVTNPRKRNKTYVDANLGGYYRFRNETVQLEAGLAIYHLFYPENNVVDPQDKESKENHRGVMHLNLGLQLSSQNALVFRNIYFSEGLYWRSKTIDNNQIIANWTGVELQRTQPSKDVFANVGLFSRNFKTVMPYLSVYWGRNLNTRFSYEQPLNSKYSTVQYTAKRLELSAVLTFFDKSDAERRRTPKYATFW